MAKILILAIALFLYSPSFAAEKATSSDTATDNANVTQDTAKKIDTANPKASPKTSDSKKSAATEKAANGNKTAVTKSSDKNDKNSPEEYSCKYYTATLPADWKAIVPPTEQQGNINAIFAQTPGKAVVTLINGPNVGADAKTIAEMFADQFKASKAPVEKNGQYSFSFMQNDSPSKAWVAVDGTEFMISIIAGNQKEAQRFLKNNITSEDYPKLLPQ